MRLPGKNRWRWTFPEHCDHRNWETSARQSQPRVGFQIRDCPPFVELFGGSHGGALGNIVCAKRTISPATSIGRLA